MLYGVRRPRPFGVCNSLKLLMSRFPSHSPISLGPAHHPTVPRVPGIRRIGCHDVAGIRAYNMNGRSEDTVYKLLFGARNPNSNLQPSATLNLRWMSWQRCGTPTRSANSTWMLSQRWRESRQEEDLRRLSALVIIPDDCVQATVSPCPLHLLPSRCWPSDCGA